MGSGMERERKRSDGYGEGKLAGKNGERERGGWREGGEEERVSFFWSFRVLEFRKNRRLNLDRRI